MPAKRQPRDARPFLSNPPPNASRSRGAKPAVDELGSDVVYDPPLPTSGELTDNIDGFAQSVRLLQNGQPIGVARWYSPTDNPEGVVQLAELSVALSARRRGHARRLLAAALTQVKSFHALRRIKVRRVWMAVPQKTQVGGRAFLTETGFHHVSTVHGLFRDQDFLVYVLALD